MSIHLGLRRLPAFAFLAVLCGFVPVGASAATLTVTSTLDDVLGNLIGNGSCELREAIANANIDGIAVGAVPGDCPAGGLNDVIAFAIPGAGPHFIEVGNALVGDLPAITSLIHIDGYSQPGASANTLPTGGIDAVPMIGIRPAGSGAAVNGLIFDSGLGGGSVRGLIVNGFQNSGININATSGLIVAGNFIGVDATGAAAAGNGVGVLCGDCPGLILGGIDAADRNLIAANSFEIAKFGSNPVAGIDIRANLIGTRADGHTPLSVGDAIYLLTADASIQNNIVGANLHGIRIEGDGTSQVVANRIGIGASGSAIGGTGNGISIRDSNGGAPSVTVGGGPGEGNIVANWGGRGVLVTRAFLGSPQPVATLLGNAIYGNGGLGIDLIDVAAGTGTGANPNDAGDADIGPSAFQNFPIAASAATTIGDTSVAWSLDSAASTNFEIQFFSSPSCDASGYGEGQVFLGSAIATTDAGGNAGGTAGGLPATTVGHYLGMTATNLFTGETSEFSACQPIVAAGGAAPAAVQPVPTLSWAGLGVLSALLSLAGGSGRRRVR